MISQRIPLPRRRRPRILIAATVLGLVAGLPASAAVAGDETPSFPGMAPAAHPEVDDAAEYAAREAALDGTPLESEPRSPRIAAALERLGTLPVPQGEAFALIKLTDRRTGERELRTRGVPLPGFVERLRDPGLDPATQYAEHESVLAEDGVEIVIRSQIAQPVPAPGPAGDPAPPVDEDAEENARLRRDNADSPFHFRIDTDLRRHLETAIGRDGAPAEPVLVSIQLRNAPDGAIPKAADPVLGGHLWAALEVRAERERVILERKQAARRLQRPLEAVVRELGGRVHYASWLSGAVEAFVPPAALDALAAHPAVLSIEKIAEYVPTNHRYMGDDVFDATKVFGFTYHSGFDGLSSRHSYTSRLVIGMAEECIREDAPAWLTAAPPALRRARFFDIDPLGFTTGGLEDCWQDGGNKEHGHKVAGLMVADFTDNQEPGFHSATEERRMTGTCPECFLVFFQDQKLNNRGEAYDRACDQGVDIFQSSIGSKSISCNGEGGRDGAIQDLTEDCGALFVQSAGNEDSDTGSCTTVYPADHPWTLAIGGVMTQDPCDDDGDWFTSNCPYDQGASRGGAKYNGVDSAASVIDLAAPFRSSSLLDPQSVGPSAREQGTGTSYSCPIVAGLAGRMMDWWKSHVSTSVFHANRMRTFMMLFGDRSIGTAGTSRTDDDTSRWWGAGRVVLFPFDDKNGWVVTRGSVSLKANHTHSFSTSMPSTVKMYKIVVWHDGKDYSTEPNIRVTLDPNNSCDTSQPAFSITRADSKVVVFHRVDGCDDVDVTIKNVKVGLSGRRRLHWAVLATSDTSERAW